MTRISSETASVLSRTIILVDPPRGWGGAAGKVEAHAPSRVDRSVSALLVVQRSDPRVDRRAWYGLEA